MSATHRTVQTPNPALRSLVVSVGEASFQTSGGILPPEGTLYDDELWRTFFGRDYNNNFSGFRYVCQTEDNQKGGQLLFVKSLTDLERNTPFRTTTKFASHHWHPMLKKLELIPDSGSARSYRTVTGGQNAVNSGPSFYVRQVYIPAVDEGSRFVIEEFFADVPYSIPQYPTPQPSNVTYDVPGVRGGFPECLHDDLYIQDIATTVATSIQDESGKLTSTGGGSSIPGQFFPATNFKKWAPYVLSDEVNFNNGYHRQRVTVFPPPLPKAVSTINNN